MHFASRCRLFLARRPWVYWLTIALVAAALGASVHRQMAEVDAARERWEETRAVLVADRDHSPGAALDTRTAVLPLAAIPASAITELPPGAVARQRIATGEVLVAADVAGAPGPASLAEPGTVVVPLADALAGTVPIGQAVIVVAEGLVVAGEATVVGVDGDLVLVAVDRADGPLVAEAGRRGTAAVLLVP